MLEASDTTPLNALNASPASDTPEENSQDSLRPMRALIERMQGQLTFKQSRIEALNFEIARLKRWRFGSSSESGAHRQALRDRSCALPMRPGL